ncbi:N-acetylmuramoyl-L-alanine amidase [Corynebacterium cystitidis DSM 20524]|uniref:CHAP domain-containing protein n=1 Tax=Corynebacterium cystitidis TaxID=35757 RepID=UPI000B94A69C|nr:CHAP domain-containing protein [Corynebacterium cystitidis]WJY83289.1 N-acetylmuramoyl-L-alanine amidase [Corynebacterium cystitidis DSM 20524]SNV63819.1 N-acetylmuramoyl-L-alanine amidase [Corynebacterium cystitidis]
MRTSLRTMITLVASLAVLAGLSAPQANAAVHNLCKEVGSYGCLAFSGYRPYTNTWADTRYYGGVHNCTRYVAYRLAKGGVPDQGTWGNAYEWWHRAPGAKNNTPAVGAIAYWSSDWTSRHWGHSYGHVGVVEKVNADGSIEVTWDSYGDNINVRQVVSGNHLPTGYIHADNAAIKRSGGIVDTPPAPQPVKDGDTIAYNLTYTIGFSPPVCVG